MASFSIKYCNSVLNGHRICGMRRRPVTIVAYTVKKSVYGGSRQGQGTTGASRGNTEESCAECCLFV